MKKIILLRHSIPERTEKKTEDISLSEEGIALANVKRNDFRKISKCYSSPYKRAMETAALIANQVIVTDKLKERIIGDAYEDFWLRQYQDHDYCNPNGESLNDVRIRMKTEIDEIVADMTEGESVLVVSHATAICSYLLSYCEIEVTDVQNKSRKITYKGKVILEGKIKPTSYFEIDFQDDIFSSARFYK